LKKGILAITAARTIASGCDQGAYLAQIEPITGGKVELLDAYGRGTSYVQLDNEAVAMTTLWNRAFDFEFRNPTITLDLPAYERLDLAIRGATRSLSTTKHNAAITELKTAIDEIGRLPKNKNYGGSI
jgi:hypothetical protein